jgi:hypothetical protein
MASQMVLLPSKPELADKGTLPWFLTVESRTAPSGAQARTVSSEQVLVWQARAQVSGLIWAGRSPRAHAPDAEKLLRGARSFAESVRDIPEVRGVVLDLGDAEPRLTTYIARREAGVRNRVYALERAFYRQFPALEVDFRTVCLDWRGSAMPAEDGPDVQVLLRQQ